MDGEEGHGGGFIAVDCEEVGGGFGGWDWRCVGDGEGAGKGCTWWGGGCVDGGGEEPEREEGEISCEVNGGEGGTYCSPNSSSFSWMYSRETLLSS